MYVSHYGFSPDFPQTQALRRQMQVIRSDVFKKIYLVLFAHAAELGAEALLAGAPPMTAFVVHHGIAL